MPIKDVTGFPIYGLDGIEEGVHLAQAMAGIAPHAVDGRIVDTPCVLTAGDYLLIACGTGDTVRAARAGAYKILDKLKMPNGPFWRIDIGERLSKELPKLQAKGYALGMTY
jgi:phosphoribosylamine--glycine ligase